MGDIAWEGPADEAEFERKQADTEVWSGMPAHAAMDSDTMDANAVSEQTDSTAEKDTTAASAESQSLGESAGDDEG